MKLFSEVRPLAILFFLCGAFITSGWAQEKDASNLSEVVAEVQGVAITLEDLQNGAAEAPWSARVRPHFRDRIRILTRRYGRNG